MCCIGVSGGVSVDVSVIYKLVITVIIIITNTHCYYVLLLCTGGGIVKGPLMLELGKVCVCACMYVCVYIY